MLHAHDHPSSKTGCRVPRDGAHERHLDGGPLWRDPSFVGYVKSLEAGGVAEPVGGAWAECIAAYFYDNFNDSSAHFKRWYVEQVFGYTPPTAWVPEGTWDDERTFRAGPSLYSRAAPEPVELRYGRWILRPRRPPLSWGRWVLERVGGGSSAREAEGEGQGGEEAHRPG